MADKNRDYPFELPLNVPWFYVGTVQRRVVDAGFWKDMPYDLAVKINTAVSNRQGFQVTKADLDQIPDDTWERAKTVLHP